MQLFLFMLVVSLIAGLVAAGGDWMGHRAARRKIRFGKMRPRHVSRLFAVITGVLISLVTFGVVFAVWKDVREAFTKYEGVKKDLIQAETFLEAMEDSLSKARKEVADADAKVVAAELEAADLNSELSTMRGQTIELAILVNSSNDELEALNDQIAAKEKERDKLLSDISEKVVELANADMRVQGLVGLKNQLGSEIESLEAKIASLLGGEIVMHRGTNLAYEKVGAGEAGLLRDRLQSALNHVVVKLAKQGLDVDPESEQRAEQFIQLYPQNGSMVIIISTAQNVIEDQSVLLAFDAVSLSPVVRKGEVVLEVKVKQGTASISAFGKVPAQVGIKSNLDAQGVDELVAAVEAELLARAGDLGFLPKISTGTISTNTSSLSGMVDQLVSKPRPYLIRFIANEEITVLDGLDNMNVVVIDAS